MAKQRHQRRSISHNVSAIGRARPYANRIVVTARSIATIGKLLRSSQWQYDRHIILMADDRALQAPKSQECTQIQYSLSNTNSTLYVVVWVAW
jgi:hypothetical protein